MTAPWVPMNVDAWPFVVETLHRDTNPWPEELCLFDLRWLFDKTRGRLPGRRTLSKRWKVSDRIARRLLSSTHLWWDTAKGDPPTSRTRPANVPGASRNRPDKVQSDADNHDKKSREGPDDVPDESLDRPDDVHRCSDHNSPAPAQSHEDPPNPPDRGAIDPRLVADVRRLLLEVQPGAEWLEAAARGVEHLAVWTREQLKTRGQFVTGTRLKAIAGALRLAVEQGIPEPATDPRLPGFEVDADIAPQPDLQALDLWASSIDDLQARIGHQDMAIWFKHTTVVPVAFNDERLQLWVANPYYHQWIAENYLDDIEACVGVAVDLVTTVRAQ